MKILMFGRGVISTIYAWILEESGNKVEFYVRPGKAAQYGPSVTFEILDARTNSEGTMLKRNWPIKMCEDLDADNDYDLIIVSINHNQLSEALSFLSPRIGKATVLIFNNIWVDPSKTVSMLPSDQIVWGFPGAGGGFHEGILKGGIMKTVYMGHIGDSNHTDRYQAVRRLFTEAGLSVSQPKDFRGWLWFHFIFNAGISARALKMGGYDKVFNSTTELKESVLLTREMVAVLKAKGDKPGLSTTLPIHLPTKLFAFLVKRSMGSYLNRYLVDQMANSNTSSYEMTSIYPRDVLADARKLGVSLPRLAALECYFK